MASITISYRRASSLLAGRIFDWLAGHFGKSEVFMDVESIPGGADFTERIRRTLDDSELLVAIIDPDWEGIGNEAIRIAQDDDWVGIEIGTALERKIPILPILIDRTHMPNTSVLPPRLHRLCDFNAVLVDSRRNLQSDMQAIVDAARSLRKQRFAPAPRIIEPLRVVDAHEFAGWGWSLERVMKIMIDQDLVTFDEQSAISGRAITLETEGSLDNWVTLYEQNPENWTMLVAGDRTIVGWSFFLALTDEAFAQFKSGALEDHDLRPKHVVPLDPNVPGSYNIYYGGLSVGVAKYRAKGGALLFAHFVHQWREYEEHEISIKELCTFAYTQLGDELCRRLDLKRIGQNSSGPIYSIEGSDLANKLRWSPAQPHNNLASLEEDVRPIFDKRFPNRLA